MQSLRGWSGGRRRFMPSGSGGGSCETLRDIPVRLEGIPQSPLSFNPA
jgi:hypothetical protein